MMSPVFFSDLKLESGKTLLDKLDILLDRADLRGKIREKDLVAIKLHFWGKRKYSLRSAHLFEEGGRSSQAV